MTANFRVLTQEESLARLMAKMPQADRAAYESYGTRQAVGIFLDRVFYVYTPEGKTKDDVQRPPKIVATVRVINLGYTVDRGFLVTLLNETTNEKQVVTVQPERLFGYNIFVHVPVSVSLRYSLVEGISKQEVWDTSLVILVKMRNESKHYSKGNTYFEPPSRMARLYPGNWAPDRL